MNERDCTDKIRVITDAIAQTDSYNKVLFDYLDNHDEIPEMMHACLIVDKMQEQIDIIKNAVDL